MIKNTNLNQRFHKIMRHFQKNSLENFQLLKKSKIMSFLIDKIIKKLTKLLLVFCYIIQFLTIKK